MFFERRNEYLNILDVSASLLMCQKRCSRVQGHYRCNGKEVNGQISVGD